MQPNKVIFLDVDGVLNSGHSGFSAPFSGGDDKNFIPRAITILRELVYERNWFICLSSSWRHHCTLDQMSLWTGIDREKFLGMTPDYMNCIRGIEIQAWFDNSRADGTIANDSLYVILDDNSDMTQHQMPFFVQTEWTIDEDPDRAGLNWEHMQKIKRIEYKYQMGYIRTI